MDMKTKVRRFAVLDLDGCVSDDRWRTEFINYQSTDPVDSMAPDCRMYHENGAQDEPFPEVVSLINRMLDAGYEALWVTGRPERFRQTTISWINRHMKRLHLPVRLLMRPDDDATATPELKVRLIKDWLQNFEGNAELSYAIDDRHDVINAYDEAFPMIKSSVVIGVKYAERDGNGRYRLSIQPANYAPPVEAFVEDEDRPEDLPREYLVDADARHAEWVGSIRDRLATATNTFEERNATYGDSAEKLAEMLATMFPQGVTLATKEDFKMIHYMIMLLAKLTRFSNSGMTHADSIHDIIVYAAQAEEAAKHHAVVVNK